MVTFPPREELQTHSRNSQKILVIPWDGRIPKIRISTQQAEALQVRLHFLLNFNASSYNSVGIVTRSKCGTKVFIFIC